MNETFEYLKMFAQLPPALRRFLREPMTLERARAIFQERLERRTENFIEILSTCIYDYPRSPYLKLLKHAGCELGDVRAMVKDKGLDGTLETLRAAGVYVLFNEFKGREPIVRKGLEIAVKASDFDNPRAKRAFAGATGGSTGLASAVYFDLDSVAAGAVSYMLTLDSHAALGLPLLQWMPILPGAGLFFILQMLYLGQSAAAWYTQTGWRDSREWWKYSSAMLYLLACLYASGAHVPFPKVLRQSDGLVFARQLRDILDHQKQCLVQCSTSLSVRVCAAAEQAGFFLEGAVFRIGGEPLTPAKAEVIRGRGARVLVQYGGVDAGSIGLACANPLEVDEVHLNTSAYAMTTVNYALPENGITVPVLNLTQLLPSASKILLNYQSDDYATSSERKCGCALEALGLTTHLHDVRSYSKLVGESVTLIGTEMVKILEQVLPARFGGSPLDFQIVEREDAAGLTRLILYIHPRLVIPDELQVTRVVLEALQVSSATADAARIIWQHAQTLRIERHEPIMTERGKFLPLYLERNRKI